MLRDGLLWNGTLIVYILVYGVYIKRMVKDIYM